MSHHIGGRGHWNKSLFSEDRARTDVHFVIDGFDDVSDATEMNGFQVLHMFPICTFGQFVHLKHAKKNLLLWVSIEVKEHKIAASFSSCFR